MSRQAFGAGNFLGLAAFGIPMDVFQINPEIPHTPTPQYKSQESGERRDASNDGLVIDISDVENGLVVSIWYNGHLRRSQRFENHWWGRPRTKKAEALFSAWLEEFKDQYPRKESHGGWPFYVYGW